jgi:hypothetical protein
MIMQKILCKKICRIKNESNLIDWTAVYIFIDENGVVRMERDHDIIDVLLKDEYERRLRSTNSSMELLPLYEVNEISIDANMPKTKDCIVAWRKKN